MRDTVPRPPKVVAYTDGACRPNPGPGGWAVILRSGSAERILAGGEAHTTNNRMELTAAIEALAVLTTPGAVELHTDSQYVQRGITEWLPNWVARRWRKSDGRAVLNADLWKKLHDAIQKHDVRWHWVRGHSGDPDNERVDRLANEAIPRPRAGR